MKGPASGKFVPRLPPPVHEALRGEALGKGVSLNGLCQGVLEMHVAGTGWPSVQSEKDAGLIARIRGFLGDSLLGVVLFGSVASGGARRESDVDLLIILDVNQELTRRLYALWDDRFQEDALSPNFVRLPARAEWKHPWTGWSCTIGTERSPASWLTSGG